MFCEAWRRCWYRAFCRYVARVGIVLLYTEELPSSWCWSQVSFCSWFFCLSFVWIAIWIRRSGRKNLNRDDGNYFLSNIYDQLFTSPPTSSGNTKSSTGNTKSSDGNTKTSSGIGSKVNLRMWQDLSRKLIENTRYVSSKTGFDITNFNLEFWMNNPDELLYEFEN